MKKNIINEIKTSCLIESIDNYKDKMGNLSTIEKYEQKVLDLKNPRLSYEFALIEGANIKAHENIVVESNDLGYIYLFARNIKGSNKERLSKIIIESKDLGYNYLYALYVKNADIKAHGNVILESQNVKYNYLFIKDIDGSDIEKHSHVLLNCANKLYLKYLKKELIVECDIDLNDYKTKQKTK